RDSGTGGDFAPGLRPCAHGAGTSSRMGRTERPINLESHSPKPGTASVHLVCQGSDMAVTETIATTDLEFARQLGQQLRVDSIRWVDVATGSLGHGLPIGVGVALAGQYLDKLPYHVWVLCGDSELAEGSIWEALDKAGHYQLSNLTAIWDINRLGQRGETEFGWNLDVYRRRVEAFGCFPIVIDGHDMASIDRAFGAALSNTGRQTGIIAA